LESFSEHNWHSARRHFSIHDGIEMAVHLNGDRPELVLADFADTAVLLQGIYRATHWGIMS
jgi:hypothetical protein